MAAALVNSENTVESHLANIYDKLNARGRVAILARLFQELHLLAAGAIRKGELLR
ncbi:MAG: LuxR C-terminal-related transcriptional regulator [Chloroflexota bacterium]|nr:LuxR C-terminal-related transcriptional regulator [Chloroflexota bacterium]